MKEEANSRVLKLQRRKKLEEEQVLKCSYCRPNRGCNSKWNRTKRSHGQQPKYKDKR